MFRSITIEGFRSIRSIKDLPLRPINILIGANGSGKSNFLEAFFFLNESAEGRKEEYVERNDGADRLLHFGSKTTKTIKIETTSSNNRVTGGHFEFASGDKLAGALIEGGFAGTVSPSLGRYQFHDTGFHSPIKKTNHVDDHRFLRLDGGNLAAFLRRMKLQYSQVPKVL